MADSKGWEQIEEKLTCRLCGELYKDPRTLSCLHTFCKECLEAQVERKEVGKACCPLCLEPFPQGGVSAIETNGAVDCLIKIFNKKEDKEQPAVEVRCGKCNEADASVTSWCIQCLSPMCGDCNDAHSKWHEFKGHSTVVIQDYVQKPKRETCKKHAKQPLNFYCKTCKITICTECAVKGHVQHTFELIDVRIKQNKEINSKEKEDVKVVNEEEMISDVRSKDQLYEGKYDYDAVEDDELSFKKGDQMYVINDEGDWWLAETVDSSKEGLIPKNYVAKCGSLEAEE